MRCCKKLTQRALIQRTPWRFLEDDMYYIGLDVHKKTIIYCGLCGDEKNSADEVLRMQLYKTQCLCGRLAGESLKIVNHVHLVVVTEFMGHIGPRFCTGAGLAVLSSLKPGNSCMPV